MNNGHSANGLQPQDTGSRGRKACSAHETEDSLSYLTQKDRFKYNKIMAGHGFDEKGTAGNLKSGESKLEEGSS